MKHLKFFAPLAGLALIVVLTASGKINDSKKIGGYFLAAVGLQNGTSSATLTLADALRQFEEQIQTLNSQVADLRSVIEVANMRGNFPRTLKRGDTGEDVSKLQELLAKFPELYPSDADASSTISGFYGLMTKTAITQFQTQAGLPETGIFDYNTREKFYESVNDLATGSSSSDFVPIDVSSIVDLNSSANSSNQTSANAATGTDASTTSLQSQVSQLSSDLMNAESEIADLQNQVATLQSASAPAAISMPAAPTPAPAPTPTPAPAPTPTSSPAAPQLTISSVQAAQITRQSATITWITSASSTSEVDYSTDSTLSVSKTLIVSSSSAVLNHAVGLTNLTSGTKYYYRAVSQNSVNGAASSTIQNFTTPS